jgi:hypothetical protein
MRGSRIAAWAITPPLVTVLSLSGASAAFAAPNGGGHDSNHNSGRVSSDRQMNNDNSRHGSYNRQGHYTGKRVFSRHNKEIRENNRVVVVVMIVYIQWDNDNNCWVYSQQEVDSHGYNRGGEVAYDAA